MATQKNSDDITDINERADDGALDDNVDDSPDDNVDDGPDDLADDGPDDSADDPDDLADDGPDDLADDGQDDLADDGPDDNADDPDDLADDGPDDTADGPDDTADGPDDTADGPDDTADGPDDGPDDGFNNSVDDSFNDDGNDGANGIVSSSIISSSTQSPTPSALVNAAGASAAPAGGLDNAAEASPASTGQSKTSVKIIGGIVAALLGILIIFSIAIFYLKRRWRAKEQKESHRGIIFDAKAQRDEEEGGGEGASFISEKKGHSREDSMASTRSKSSTDDYLKTGRKRSSLGTYTTPGVAPEEAYMMFGGSTTDLNDEDEKKPLTYHQRHLSENSTPSNRHSWSGAPAPTDPRVRRISLLDDDSRYPAINGSTDSLGVRPQQMRHSVSYPSGVADPFSDSTPTGSPRAPSKALTTGDVHGSPPGKPLGARPPPPPGSPSGGRRISLKGGVGVRQARSMSTGGSPVTTPKSAWK